MQSITRSNVAKMLVLMLVLLTVVALAGCKGSDGNNGANGAPGTNAPTTGTVSGTVTSATGAVALLGVAVTTNPVVSGATATTAADGSYSLALPGGSYTLTFAKTNYTSATANVNVANGVQTPASATLAEASSGAPSVAVVASGNDVGYGTTFTATATATSPIGATLTYVWSGATLSSGNTATYTSQTFSSSMAGVAAPSNDPGGYTSPFILNDRLEVLPINADTRGAKSASVTVTDGQGGKTTVSVSVNSAAPQPGVRQITLGVAAYINSGSSSTSQTWSIVKPTGSSATISTASTGTARVASFTPDVEGKYSIASSVSGTIDVWAAKFVGAISGGGYTSKTFSSTDPKAGMFFDPADAGGFGYFKGGTASSWTYTNWPTVTQASDCAGCHNGSFALNVWTQWQNTAHATFFSRGLEGITGNSSSCTACHTVGSDGVNVSNGGYDDLVASTGFKYTKAIGAWSKMSTSYPTVARVANIQCENCHGAQGTIASGHMTAGTGGSSYVSSETSSVAARVSFSADVCGTCHSSGTGHHNFSEWKKLDPDTGFGHGNKATAIAEGASTSCARCHTAQGYSLQLTQLNAGNVDSLPAASINWNAASSEPQTCTACHDPHDVTNPNELRVYDSTPLLPSGFSVVGLGKGAICVSCHNSRNGKITATSTYLHEDSQPTNTGLVNYNGGIPGSYSAPHQAAQGDVFMGRNAYFMGYGNLPMMSKHANVEDACVGCHMVLNPQTHLSHGAAAVSGHVFYIRDQDKATVCANCHSSNVDGEALVANVENMLGQLATKLENAMLSRIISAQTTTTVCVTDGNTSAKACLGAVTTGTAIALEEVHGQIGFQIQGYDVQLGSFVTGTTAGTPPVLVPKSDVIVRGGWNYFLIEGDASKGIHNPSFATQVLSLTTATVQ